MNFNSQMRCVYAEPREGRGSFFLKQYAERAKEARNLLSRGLSAPCTPEDT
jgi:hypothetical protein